MRLTGTSLFCVGLAVSGVARAQAPEPEAIRKPHLVVLITSGDETAGRQEANRAGDRLGYAIAPDTLRKPLARRVYVGNVITLQRVAENRFAVVSYLGDEAHALEALAEAKKYYAGARAIPTELPKGANDDWAVRPFYRFGILIVGSYKSYGEALRAAKSFAAHSDYPYVSRGMVFDKKRGLIWPDDSKDEAWAGAYAPRRDDKCNVGMLRPCVTVERSGAYEGFTPGLYIVVGGVLDRSAEREERLAAVQRIVPGAYVKQTAIYMGCMH